MSCTNEKKVLTRITDDAASSSIYWPLVLELDGRGDVISKYRESSGDKRTNDVASAGNSRTKAILTPPLTTLSVWLLFLRSSDARTGRWLVAEPRKEKKTFASQSRCSDVNHALSIVRYTVTPTECDNLPQALPRAGPFTFFLSLPKKSNY